MSISIGCASACSASKSNLTGSPATDPDGGDATSSAAATSEPPARVDTSVDANTDAGDAAPTQCIADSGAHPPWEGGAAGDACFGGACPCTEPFRCYGIGTTSVPVPGGLQCVRGSPCALACSGREVCIIEATNPPHIRCAAF